MSKKKTKRSSHAFKINTQYHEALKELAINTDQCIGVLLEQAIRLLILTKASQGNVPVSLETLNTMLTASQIRIAKNSY